MITFQEAKKKVEDFLCEKDKFIQSSEEIDNGWVFSTAHKRFRNMDVTSVEILIVIDKEDGEQVELHRTIHQMIAGISINQIYEEMRNKRLSK